MANELIDYLKEYCPGCQVRVRNYWVLVDYLRTDKGSLSGFALLDQFTWSAEDPLTEDFLAAGVEEWANSHNIWLIDREDMRQSFCYYVEED